MTILVCADPSIIDPALLKKQIIAFPIFSDEGNGGPAHWTLGTLVDVNWQREGLEIQNDPSWHLFHFDSTLCNLENRETANAIGRFILQKVPFKFMEIPVPIQSPTSNDCGLYPAHFLRIFLTDVEKSIKFCFYVCILLYHIFPNHFHFSRPTPITLLAKALRW